MRGKGRRQLYYIQALVPAGKLSLFLASDIDPIADNCKYVSVQGHATLSGLDPLP